MKFLLVVAFIAGLLLPATTANAAGKVSARVTAELLNLRSGPGTDFAILAQLKRGEKFVAAGRSADWKWYAVETFAGAGWLYAPYTRIYSGSARSLKIMEAPPAPDVSIEGASIYPVTPIPGEVFTLTATISNRGSAPADKFMLAASFAGSFSSAMIERLDAGATINVSVAVSVPFTTADAAPLVLNIAPESDLAVSEGPHGDRNNTYMLEYRIDLPYMRYGEASIPPYANVDLYGNARDLAYDGTLLQPLNGARLGLLNTNLPRVHYGLLTPEVIANTAGIPDGALAPGAVIGIYTAEGQRGIIHVLGRDGLALKMEYYIYADNKTQS